MSDVGAQFLNDIDLISIPAPPQRPHMTHIHVAEASNGASLSLDNTPSPSPSPSPSSSPQQQQITSSPSHQNANVNSNSAPITIATTPSKPTSILTPSKLKTAITTTTTAALHRISSDPSGTGGGLDNNANSHPPPTKGCLSLFIYLRNLILIYSKTMFIIILLSKLV